MITNLQQRFETFIYNGDPKKPDDVLSFFRQELLALAEEVFDLHGTSEQAVAVIRNRANELE